MMGEQPWEAAFAAVTAALRLGIIDEGERQRLLDALDAVPRSDADLTAVTDGPEAAHVLLKALGHEDCVPRSEIEKPADVLNSRDAVTEGDEELWERSPGDALAKAMAEILDESVVMSQTAAHQSRRAERAERERDEWKDLHQRSDGAYWQAKAERDALRADAARYRDLCREWRAACSADADADAEPSSGAQRIGAERKRQIMVEGYTPEHDQQHTAKELMNAAIAYLQAARRASSGIDPTGPDHPVTTWPWESEAWKPSIVPERNLEKAGALVAAALDRVADVEPSRADRLCDRCGHRRDVHEFPNGPCQAVDGACVCPGWPRRCYDQEAHNADREHGQDLCGCAEPEPSRAEGESPHVAPTCAWPCTRLAGHKGICNTYASDCHACDGDSDAEDPCYECGRGTEGGRPRKADPQTVSGLRDDASVDDGRSRAYAAAREGIKRRSSEGWGDDPPSPEDFAEAAIDAALASGGVVPREDCLHERWWGNAHFADWKRARDRASELEEALSDLVAASRSLFPLDDTPPDLVEALSRARAALGEANR